MSDFPASLADLAEAESRIDARLTRIEKRQEAEAEVTDGKVHELRLQVIALTERLENAEPVLIRALGRLAELERLWAVALENPELIRELAAQALKGRRGG